MREKASRNPYRIPALLLSALLCLALIGCGGQTPDPTPAPTTAPTPAPTKEPPVIQTAALVSPPANPTIELLVEDADLQYSDGAILEPQSPPYNIGGWLGSNVIWDEIEVSVAGDYSIGILYARAYTEASLSGIINLRPENTVNDSSTWVQLSFDVNNTSADEGDWSEYTYDDQMSAYLEAGTYGVEIYADTKPSDEHFINLRSIMFVLEGGGEAAQTSEAGAKERTFTLADFDGWWYLAPAAEYPYISEIFYIDSEAETYTSTDKYGNKDRTEEVIYNSEDDTLFVSHHFAMEDITVYFNEDGNMDELYIKYQDMDEPVYFRGEAPVAPTASLDGLPGKWYRDGITEGDEVYILELSQDGTYRFVDDTGSERESGGFELRVDEIGENTRDGRDRYNLLLEHSSAQITSDKRIIAIAIFSEEILTARGEPLYIGNRIFLHESEIGSDETFEAVQRFSILTNEWITEDEGSVRFGDDGWVSYHGRNDRGFYPVQAGYWNYSDSVLSISWEFNYQDGYNLVEKDEVEEEEVEIEIIGDSFTLPSLGRLTKAEMPN